MPDDGPENCRPVEIVGQVRGVQMHPPGKGDDGGSFQILMDNGDLIVSPYPAEWHMEVVAALQSNDIHRAKVKGTGEYSSEGKLRRIRQIESFDILWEDNWQQKLENRHKRLDDI
jgi:hypothetical protein